MTKRRTMAVAALCAVSVLGAAAARETAIGRDSVAAADAAAAKSDWPEAIARARAAAEALVPGSPWPERGFRRLEGLGHDAEARGDDPTALLAYGAMRTAALETRAVGSRTAHWQLAAEEGLARVAASSKETAGARLSAESMLTALRDETAPSTGPFAVLAAASVAMISGLGVLAVGAARGPGARVAKGVVAAGFVAYAITMLMSAR